MKMHVNVGTIGHVDHGKTTLTTVLTQLQAQTYGGKALQFDQIDRAKEERERGITINASHVSYESATRCYAHIDCPGHADYVKNMITGASQMDGGILLVDATEGPAKQTVEHIILAKQVGVAHMVVFVNKMDCINADELEETAELIELVVGEQLAAHDYHDVPFVFGSALQALLAIQRGEWDAPETEAIKSLVETLDRAIPDPVRDYEGPFMMPIEDVMTIGGRGTVVTGRIERGRVRVGDEVALVGLGDGERTLVVTGAQSFHQDVAVAEAGMNVGLLLRGLKREEVCRGQVLTAPGVLQPRTTAKAHIYVLSKEEGGRHTPFGSGYQPQFFFGTTDVTGVIDVGDPGVFVSPGDQQDISFTLMKPVGLEPGIRFAIREGSKTVGAGMVTEVLA
ncbi:elongation factor Tu [Acanthopleuribacter pedis]|uniref:Elongation factor Tu n=1 Tax=Acanthopleuribacter pedis TaxID=442870 RepID=A0A8J7QMD8_9BACT|nr:elongation factor Tu [Acanthopleuribacter pedis]MBO1321038.1 elongation factor Tu [Acanthopleuribacter pedis]